jgi:hypothetical protein
MRVTGLFIKPVVGVGTLPALAYVAWKYRDQITSLVHRARRNKNLLKSGEAPSVA